ncbi:MAG: type II toxin-antitoxin system RelE/ParE family toxin [Bacteroidota bacterium]|nr:type II toxin-antitoxin system RelE/ParE family toxin [Bacteroidota bacterium]
MKRYEIIFARSARKEVEDLNELLSEKIFFKIDELVLNPRPPGCEKIKGSQNRWRIRVGDYRVIYFINDKICLLEILIIRHRRDVYR